MGHKFSLVLSREIDDKESTALREAVAADPLFGTDTLPTDADVTVTKMDFDDTVSPSLAEAIESALEAVKLVPDLSAPGLTVPAQPAEAPADNPPVVAGEVIEDEPASPQEKPAPEKPAPKKPATRKTSAKKTSTRKASTKKPATKNSANGAASPEQASSGTE